MDDLRTGICPLCDHREVLRRQVTEFSGKASYQVKLAFAYGEAEGIFDHALQHPHGLLWMYVCRGCGYAQWFAQDPAKIPIDPALGIELVKGPDKGLYRG